MSTLKRMEKILTIANTKGLHAALANKIVRISHRYDVELHMAYEHVTIDAKSILGLMSLAVPYGENVKVIAIGPDAVQAIREIENII
jgi:phosphocarrier protein